MIESPASLLVSKLRELHPSQSGWIFLHEMRRTRIKTERIIVWNQAYLDAPYELTFFPKFTRQRDIPLRFATPPPVGISQTEFDDWIRKNSIKPFTSLPRLQP
jgi:hypothetical protein